VRLEYAVVMDLIARRFPNLRLSAQNRFADHRNIAIRSLDSLYVDLDG
jgi:hypothetical protein